MSQPIKIIIVDDHPLIKEGVKQILSFYEDICIVGEGSNGEEAISLVAHIPCDILLLDINMPILNGIDAVKQIKMSHPRLKIILLTIESDFHTLKEAIDLQIEGYILKESAGTTLINAIRHVHSDGNFIDQAMTKHIFHIVQGTTSPIPQTSSSDNHAFELLSTREKEILFYISKGMTNKQIGSKLFLSEKTIRNCSTSLFRKINVKDRVQATIYALNHNIESYLSIDKPF